MTLSNLEKNHIFKKHQRENGIMHQNKMGNNFSGVADQFATQFRVGESWEKT